MSGHQDINDVLDVASVKQVPPLSWPFFIPSRRCSGRIVFISVCGFG